MRDPGFFLLIPFFVEYCFSSMKSLPAAPRESGDLKTSPSKSPSLQQAGGFALPAYGVGKETLSTKI